MSRISLNYKSLKGSKTSRNEDEFTWFSANNQEDFEKKGSLFIIVDGFGGRNDAGVSSHYIAKEIAEKFYSDETSRTTRERLLQTIKEVNGKFYRDWKEANDRRGVGASVSLLALKCHSACVANIGDSKVFLLRERALKTMTKDFSWTAQQDNGPDKTMRNILTVSLGSRPVVEPQITSVNVKSGDIFIMTSDGVTDFLDEGEIREICLYRYSEEMPGIIVSSAVKAGSDDDTTIAVLKINEVPLIYSDIPERKLERTVDKREDISPPAQEEKEKTPVFSSNQFESAEKTGEIQKEKQLRNDEPKKFNFKILFALIPVLLLILAVIFNPFNFLQKKAPEIETAVDSVLTGSNDSVLPAPADSFYRIDIINVSKISGTAMKAQILLSSGIDSLFDSTGPGFGYAILNGQVTEAFQSSLNLFSVAESSQNSKTIIGYFKSLYPDSSPLIVRDLHLVIETGDDLANGGHFLPDSSLLQDLGIETLNVCIVSRFPDDSLAGRLFRSLDENRINGIPIKVVAIIESPDTAQKNQTRILASEKNLRLARLLAHAMGLRDDFYVWSDPVGRFIFLINRDASVFIQ